ncbi:archaemetzincin family Zn-dependent metalloprotease [Thermodesulfobacteriota bacterium]
MLPKHKIVISPIGVLNAEIVEHVRREITRIFSYQTEVVPLLEEVLFAFDQQRNQFHSTSILEKLSAIAPADAAKVLAITSVDLFIPILTHVYGEAQLGGKACVISTYRLDEDLPSLSGNRVLLERAGKEAVHEMGHTFSLRHCKDSTCIMHYCRTIKDVDRKSEQLCRYCAVMLEDEKKRIG